MKKYLETVRAYERRFKGFSVQHIPRAENTKADEIAKMSALELKMPPEVFFEVLTKSAVDGIRLITTIHEEDWREQIEAYLRRETNPQEGSEEEKCIQQRAQTYLLIGDKLYKVGICGP